MKTFNIGDEVDPMGFDHMMNLDKHEYVDQAFIVEVDNDRRIAWVDVTIEDGRFEEREEQIEVPFAYLELLYEPETSKSYLNTLLTYYWIIGVGIPIILLLYVIFNVGLIISR